MSIHHSGDAARLDDDLPRMGVGRFLQQLRKARRFSLERLATESCVSARSLSYWEAGTHKPRLPELEAVLRTLGATLEEQTQARRLIGVPHAISRQNIPNDAARIPLPCGGDLLRAMRHRRRMHLRQVADLIGTATSTVSRWESGQVVPNFEQLSRLLTVLEAHPEERVAILEPTWQGEARLCRADVFPAALSVEDLFGQFVYNLWENMEDKLNDLRFLTFETMAWRLVNNGERDAARQQGIRLLAEVYAHYASYLEAFSRFGEAASYAYRALDVAQEGSARSALLLRAAFASAKAEVYRSEKPRPKHGIHILERWESRVRRAGNVAYEAWLLSSKAEYLSLAGQNSAAILVGQRACQLAEGFDANELRLRQRDLAKIYMSAGQIDAALNLVSFSTGDTPYWRTQVNLLWSEGLYRLGDAASAETYLTRAEEDCRLYDLLCLRNVAGGLRTRFA